MNKVKKNDNCKHFWFAVYMGVLYCKQVYIQLYLQFYFNRKARTFVQQIINQLPAAHSWELLEPRYTGTIFRLVNGEINDRKQSWGSGEFVLNLCN